MRVLVVALLLLGTFAMGLQVPTADANGCTPCECGIHICQDGAEFVPELRNVSAARGDNVVNITWQAALRIVRGNLTPNLTYGMDSTILYDRIPHYDENGTFLPTSGNYPFHRSDFNLSFPGTHTVPIIWPNEEPLYFSMSHGWWITESHGHFEPAERPPAAISTERTAAGLPFVLALLVAVTLCILRFRQR